MKKTLNQGKLPAVFLSSLLDKLSRKDKNVIIPPGIGLDAAGLKIGKNLLAVTMDPITLSSTKIATYSVAVNINDIACLGCKPRWYTATLLLPKNTDRAFVENIFQELADELKRYKITAIGGHIEVTDTVNTPILVGQIIGESFNNKLLDARNAKSGDQILLCQPIAIEGTALISSEKTKLLAPYFSKNEIKKMQGLLENPGICILPLVKKIIKIPGIVAFHDPTEGGVATALHELADAADCGLQIDYSAINILPCTQKLAKIFNIDPLGLLASGSLLVVCKDKAVGNTLKKLGATANVIGQFISNRKERILFKGKRKRRLPRFDRDEITLILP
jgi:hydrogenase maturation factor